jgi:hypothetical protein
MVTRCSLITPGSPFSGTTDEKDLLVGTLRGSFAIPPSVQTGTTIYLKTIWLTSWGAATNFTVRLKCNGTTVLTTVLNIGAATPNVAFELTYSIQLRFLNATNHRIFSNVNVSKQAGVSVVANDLNDTAWVIANTNTLSLTGQFSDTNGTWRVDFIDVWSNRYI